MHHSLHVTPLQSSDVHTPLHVSLDWSAIFHFVAPLTDLRVPLHAPSNGSSVFHFVASLTDMHAPLHAPSDQSAVFHFVAPLIGSHVMYMFLLLTSPFLILMRLWHCLCCCRNGSCSYTRHDTNPPWYKLKASCCKEGIPKRFNNDDTTVWIFVRCKTQTWKFMCGRLPGKRIVCSASKVTTCSSVYQTCQVVVNSMLHQQGDNTLIMYQSCHATATLKQDDSHYK